MASVGQRSAPPLRSRQGLGASKSNPSLASSAYYNLRDFRGTKKTLGTERMENLVNKPSIIPETMKERDRRLRLKAEEAVLEQRDEDERGVVKAIRVAKKKEHEIRVVERVKAEAAIKFAQDREIALNWRHMEEEKKRWEAERLEKINAAKVEEERIKVEKAEADRVRRIPRVCEICNGSGVCIDCKGLGIHQHTFLSGKVNEDTRLEFGHGPQGCETCMGYQHGIRGGLREGHGLCCACSGIGRFCTGFCKKKRAFGSRDEESDGICKRCGSAEVEAGSTVSPRFIPTAAASTNGAWV